MTPVTVGSVGHHPGPAQGATSSVDHQSTHTAATAVETQLMWTSEPKTAPVPLAGLLHNLLAKQAPLSLTQTQWPRVTQLAESPKGQNRASTAASITSTALWSSTRPLHHHHHHQCLSTKSHSQEGCHPPPSRILPTQNMPTAQGTAQKTPTSLVS